MDTDWYRFSQKKYGSPPRNCGVSGCTHVGESPPVFSSHFPSYKNFVEVIVEVPEELLLLFFLILSHILCEVDVSYETPPFIPVLRFLPCNPLSDKSFLMLSSHLRFGLHHHHSLAHMFYFLSQYMPILFCIFLDIILFRALFCPAWCIHSSILTFLFLLNPTSSLVLSSVPMSCHRTSLPEVLVLVLLPQYVSSELIYTVLITWFEVVIWDLAFHALSLYIPTTLSQMCGFLLRKPFSFLHLSSIW